MYQRLSAIVSFLSKLRIVREVCGACIGCIAALALYAVWLLVAHMFSLVSPVAIGVASILILAGGCAACQRRMGTRFA